MTAKHGCGFLLWNTSTTLPNGTAYPYAVMRSDRPSFQRDVIAEFSKLTAEAGLGQGYYFSTGNNYFLNRVDFKRIGDPLPGQVDVSDEEYNNLVYTQSIELWSRFGSVYHHESVLISASQCQSVLVSVNQCLSGRCLKYGSITA